MSAFIQVNLTKLDLISATELNSLRDILLAIAISIGYQGK